MVDETTVNCNHKQVVMYFRWVSNDFEIHEEFASLHIIDSIDAITIVQAIATQCSNENASSNKQS